MKVTLLAHTQVSDEFVNEVGAVLPMDMLDKLASGDITDAQLVALTAIRTCYSPNKPSEIVSLEGGKYFGAKATDGKEGTEADRLIRHVLGSKHLSTVEHLNFTFAIEGVSRALLAQLTRHRVGFAYSVQSQRYVKFSSDSKSGGFDYVVPEKVINKGADTANFYLYAMKNIQYFYDELIEMGIPQEDARSVLPQSATCNLVLTVNLRALLDFYAKRRAGKGAQQEITVLAEELKNKVVGVEPWTAAFFGGGSK
ncbi:thymidylate synthase (FAD) [Bacillus cereus]|uniref:FAD-dependent thymidylate synthase n=1 Tax=Bacillus cereus TaxID=1396 RepID=UPI000BF35666|nr:FAD-dependent thymidylate synthase [Bacillus cereus]PEZ87936.1 thymidylate synthase (FAD) [Bacillus cereus]PFR12588.1 thymidylate synthase (FAD) [Bacillus cereus]